MAVPRKDAMNFDIYTDRARGFVQAAQSLALREGHQQFGTDHLLKDLIDDPDGLASRRPHAPRGPPRGVGGPLPQSRWGPAGRRNRRGGAGAGGTAEGLRWRRRP